MIVSRRQACATLALGFTAVATHGAHAASASEISRDARAALDRLLASEPAAQALNSRSVAVLVFPTIIKAGFIIGGQGGDGALFVGGRTEAYYNIAAASFGLQAGAQTFSYALFFVTQSALSYLSRSNGWAIGSGPSIVIVDKGAAASLTSTTLTQDVYAFPFGQRGLMAGIGLEGSKITRIHPAP